MTVEPTAMTPAVEFPAIDQVISVKTGVPYAAAKLIKHIRCDRWIRLRRENAIAIRAGRPRLICQICHVPVRFAFSTQKRAFFRHVSENVGCPAITRSGRTLDNFREMIYRGQQESRLHKETKQIIADGLDLDPDFRDVAMETTWKSGDGSSLRRPDVRAVGPSGIRFAFEAQLTSTFLDAVVERSAFYAAEGGLLVWILRRFDPSYRRATEDDIIFPNNSNAIVVDKATADASRAAGRFMVRVHHQTISLTGEYGWADSLLPFSSLTYDIPGQRTFVYDFEQIEAEILAALGRRRDEADKTARKAAAQRTEARCESLRRRVKACFADEAGFTQEEWDGLRRSLSQEGIQTPSIGWSVARVVNALASAELGQVTGYKLKNLIAVANYLHDNHRGAVRAFVALIDINGHRTAFHAAGDQVKWKAKEDKLLAEARDNDSGARLPAELRKLIFFLFPSLTQLPGPLTDPPMLSNGH